MPFSKNKFERISKCSYTNFYTKQAHVLQQNLFPRASLASLTYTHRETHMPIVKLHVQSEPIGAGSHIHNRDIQILCILH